MPVSLAKGALRQLPLPSAISEKIRQVIESIGGASRDRTDDLIVANDGVPGSDLTDSIRLDSFFSTEKPRLLEQ